MAVSSEILTANLQRLAQHPLGRAAGEALVRGLLDTDPAAGTWLTARDGSQVPCLPAAPAPLPLHSRFEPAAEAARLYASLGPVECLVLVGAGAGWLARTALQDPGLRLLVLWEPHRPTARWLWESLDWGPLLDDPRVVALPGLPPVAFGGLFLQLYSPLWHGNPQLQVLRPVQQAQPELTAAAVQAFEAALEAGKADWSTQAHLGKRWSRHLLENLGQIETAPLPWTPKTWTVIAAAGPGLETARSQLPPRSDYNLIATDTALPALLQAGLVPDLVVSLDCQITSVQHLLDGFPPEVPFLFDLASPPPLVRLVRRRWFFRSRHPLAQLLPAEAFDLPEFEVRGGNVTHLALVAARHLGSGTILLAGADFSYPQGRSYARSTYVHAWFDRRQNRLQPLEHRLYAFAHRTPQMLREPSADGRLVATNTALMGYRDALVAEIRAQALDVRALPGPGLTLDLPTPEKKPSPPSAGQPLNNRTAPQAAESFRRWYRYQLENLPPWTPGLSPANLSLWQSLAPLALHLLRKLPPDTPKAAVLEQARREILDFLTPWG